MALHQSTNPEPISVEFHAHEQKESREEKVMTGRIGVRIFRHLWGEMGLNYHN